MARGRTMATAREGRDAPANTWPSLPGAKEIAHALSKGPLDIWAVSFSGP